MHDMIWYGAGLKNTGGFFFFFFPTKFFFEGVLIWDLLSFAILDYFFSREFMYL